MAYEVFRPLREYSFFGDVDLNKLEGIHNLVGQVRKDLIANHDLQDSLLNGGYEMEEGERPESFFDLVNAVFNRTKVLVNLDYLEKMIGLATQPQIIGVSSGPAIIAPEGFSLLYPERNANDLKAVRLDGLDVGLIESLQKGWFNETRSVESIRDYHRKLSDAFGEYNMQFVNNLLIKRVIRRNFHDWENSFYQRIKPFINDGRLFVELDTAYYHMAQRYFGSIGRLWEELANGEAFARHFVLTTEESNECVRLIHSKSSFMGD